MRATGLLLTLSAAGALAAEPQGLPAPEGAERTARLERLRASYALPVAPALGDEAFRRLTGRLLWESFRVDAPETTSADIAEAYRTVLRDRGFRILFDCTATACGGLDFRFAADLMPAPEMLVDAADFVQISAERAGETPAYASVLVSRVLGQVYVQVVGVVPASGAVALAPPPPMAPDTPEPRLPGEGAGLLDRLRADGHVAVSGLSFDTGGAALSPSSAAALDALADTLRAADLAIVIVGHSDNEGTLEANRGLSERRAVAVLEALVARGVPAARMSAEGVGFLAPLTTNATEAGRAINRRVELVLR